MYLRCNRRHSPLQTMRSFSSFFLCSPVTFVIQTGEISNFLFNLFFRSSHWRCSVKKVLESLSNNVAGPQVCDFIKKSLQRRCFPLRFVKILRTPILKNISERLFLALFFFQIRFSRFNCISIFKFETDKNFHISAVTFLLSCVINFENYRILFFHSFTMNLRSKITDVSVVFL